MKLKFVDQQFQTDAVNAIVDIFDGAKSKESIFTIDNSASIDSSALEVKGQGVTYELGYANKHSLTNAEILENVRKIQERNNIVKTNDLNNHNFSVEMETGTGKTYVYTKTILELNKRYGFTKFIIVVPSIAIKEGVYKSLQVTEEHFKLRYDNTIYSYFVYDSSKLNRIQTFSTSTNVEIMIINIDAFRRSLSDKSKSAKIHKPTDDLSGNRPIDLIASTNPVVIIDEPQSVDNTPKSKEAMATLNAMTTLRYSATHKETYNIMYRLTPVDAYQQHLVKQIEVASITNDEVSAKPYIKLISVSDKDGYSCQLEITRKKKDGSYYRGKVTGRLGDDLWELSNQVGYYENQNFIIHDIDSFEGEESVLFQEGTHLTLGQATGSISDEAIKRAQIRRTIELHLKKEKAHLKQGIKVLSLFFIDRVDNYRIHYEDGTDEKGIYAKWFEEEYTKLINGSYAFLKQKYPEHYQYEAEAIHDGYFSKDKKNRLKDTKGDSKDDDSTYELIMKDKEKLLDLKIPLRFIFSHSTLKEGWDNPNVFQVCTLVETKDTFTKRQKIGRGLRICVNQDGDRVLEPKFNELSVIANESYKDFASGLQKEFEKEAGYKFGIIEQLSFTEVEFTDMQGKEYSINQEDSKFLYKFLEEKSYINNKGKVNESFFKAVQEDSFEVPEKFEVLKPLIQKKIESLSQTIEIKEADRKVEVKINEDVMLSDEFKTAFNKIKQKTFYSIQMNIERFVYDAREEILKMPLIEAEKVYSQTGKIDIGKEGIKTKGMSHTRMGDVYEFETPSYPDVIRRLQESTNLTRKTIIEILTNLHERLNEFNYNPELFIKQVSDIINRNKSKAMVQGIKYHKLDDYYKMEEIFDDEGLYGHKDKNVLESESLKHVFDHVIFDSKGEKLFAEAVEHDENVLVYAKLPTTFKIDTPYGNYSPDWVLVMRVHGEERLYFVAETKGNKDYDQLRATERGKIDSATRHFEIFDNDLKYRLVKELRELQS